MSAEFAAMRQVADCGVLRVSFDSSAHIALLELGVVTASPVDGNDDALDYRLSDKGREMWAAINP